MLGEFLLCRRLKLKQGVVSLGFCFLRAPPKGEGVGGEQNSKSHTGEAEKGPYLIVVRHAISNHVKFIEQL